MRGNAGCVREREDVGTRKRPQPGSGESEVPTRRGNEPPDDAGSGCRAPSGVAPGNERFECRTGRTGRLHPVHPVRAGWEQDVS